jgi:hypothetical protein
MRYNGKEIFKQSESQLQSAIVQILRFNNILVFSIPNGIFFNALGKSKFTYMNKLKREGFLAGASDLVILTKKQPYFVEIKTKNGKQSDTQKLFQENVKKLGYQYLIWRSHEDAEDFVKNIKKVGD